MKIAAISITYNDDFKFNEWCENYEEYKKEIYLHIIVDNGSKPDYIEKVKKYFKNSYIIERGSNGGCTGAYNDGINYALSIKAIDSVMLLANDIKLMKGSISNLHKNLFSDNQLGMVSPIILKKNTLMVEDFGCRISNELILKEYKTGELLGNLKEDVNYCEAVPGGLNLATRKFYEIVGLQDDKLFMYSDEVDMGLRAKKNGLKMASYKDSIAWHNHINPKGNNSRGYYTKYLTGRNKIYLAKKHFGEKKSLTLYIIFIVGSIIKMIMNLIKGNYSSSMGYIHFAFGSTMGLFGQMQSNKYSRPD